MRFGNRNRDGTPQFSRGEAAILTGGIWTALGIFQAMPELWLNFTWAVLVAKVIEAWAWALLTPAILWIDRRYVSFDRWVAGTIALLLGLSVVLSVVHLWITAVLLYPFPDIWWSPLRTPQYATYYFLGGWQMSCALIAIIQAFKFNSRSLISQFELERVEKRLLESHLNALRLQLEPHFLFNTLNAISSEVEENPALAREMIDDLAVLLRRSLDYKDSAEITLAQEMALLEHYLAIQKVRFGARIDIQIHVDPETLTTPVPSLLLQPMVENAIRHGIEGRLSGGRIEVSAHGVGDEVEIRVIDDGVGLAPDWQTRVSNGIGVAATRERLEALYPAIQNHFAMLPHEGGGTEVVIRVPRQAKEAE